MTGNASIIRGNALALPLADASVDLVVTSPPYFGLRSYQDGGEHYAGQIGAEPTPAEFVDALIKATAEMIRVLKPSGSIWVNLGDKYCADNRGSGGDAKRGEAKWAPVGKAGFPGEGIVKQKSLMGIPWRYAIRCIDDLGLILRAEAIWAKPNGLPESVTDRVRRSHEQWFHFTKEPRYFSAVDEIREEHLRSWGGSSNGGHTYGTMKEPGAKDANLPFAVPNPLGKLPGSVWTIATQPLQVPPELGIDHFAAFPMEWPRRIIQGWSPAGVCRACGEGRRPVSRARAVAGKPFAAAQQADSGREWHGGDPTKRTLGTPAADRERTITGYACACPDASAPTVPAVVLDPFGGTGTTATVAKALGRTGISVDMSTDYCRLATWRTNDEKQLARAIRTKPAPRPRRARPVPAAQPALDI